MRGRKHCQAILDEIRRVGGSIDRQRWGGRGGHLIVYWSLGRKKFWETISQSPSDPYATNNGINNVRRRARQARSKPDVFRLSA